MSARQAIKERLADWRGQYVRGHQKIPERAHPLVRQFVNLMNQEGATYVEVAERSGVGFSTFYCWHTRHEPKLSTLEAALNVLGYELVIRPKRGE